MSRHTKSEIWRYFEYVNLDSAKCNKCGKLYSRKGRTTTSLKNHLRSSHPQEFLDFLSKDMVRLDNKRGLQIYDSLESKPMNEQQQSDVINENTTAASSTSGVYENIIYENNELKNNIFDINARTLESNESYSRDSIVVSPTIIKQEVFIEPENLQCANLPETIRQKKAETNETKRQKIFDEGGYRKKFSSPSQDSTQDLPHDGCEKMDDTSEIEEKINSGLFQLVQKRKGKSEIWTIFAQILKDDETILDGFVCCRTCKNLFKYNGRHSSNLNRHKCFNLISPSASIKRVSEEDKQGAIDACTIWVIEDCRPFTAIEGTGFRKMVNFFLKTGARYGTNIDINDLLPDPSTLSRRITKTAQEKKNEVKSKIAKIVSNGEASVTIDLWQDSYVKRNFLCATLHFQKNFKLIDIVLGMKSMDLMRSSGQNVHCKLQCLLSEFGVNNLKNIVFVTDRGSNVKKALEKYTRLNCSSHLFSNVLDSAFECTGELTEVTSSCRKVVKYFKKASLQHMLQTSLKSHCPARWNSLYVMFKSISDNWIKVNEILTDNSETQRLSSINILILQCLVELCANFDVIFKKLQEYSFPSICFIIPSINRLKEICEVKENDVQAISALKSNILIKLEEIWVLNLSIWHKTAFFLYPPAIYEQESDLDEIKQFCIKEITYYEQNESLSINQTLPTTTSDLPSNLTPLSIPSPPNLSSPISPLPILPAPNLQISHSNVSSENPSKNSPNASTSLNKEVRFFFPNLLKRSMMSAPESAREEVSRYCMENILIDEHFDVMQWWRGNSTKYPRLSKLALRILSIPASSAASERVFSLAGNIITEKRNRLAPKTVGNILFLNSFYKNFSF